MECNHILTVSLWACLNSINGQSIILDEKLSSKNHHLPFLLLLGAQTIAYHVGLQHAVPPTNTKFKPLFLCQNNPTVLLIP